MGAFGWSTGYPTQILLCGDSVMAGIASALCCGATPAEAALAGNLVASITIQQIGTTGTATPAQVREQFLCQAKALVQR